MGIVDDCVARILKKGHLSVGDRENGHGGLIMPPYFEEEIDSMYPHPESVEHDGEELLGHYEMMASPGKLVLHQEPLSSFFWHHAREIFRAGYYIEENDLKFMCHMVVLKTYTHEQFHHFCDVARHLFGGCYDRLPEEALAVTWSYIQLEEYRRQWNSKEARLSAGIFRELLPKLFRYKAPGYRDWVNFRVRADFDAALIRYTGPMTSMRMEQNGIDMNAVLLSIFESTKTKGVVEEIQ